MTKIINPPRYLFYITNLHLIVFSWLQTIKVACELADKLKEMAIDIDASDKENQLAVVDYVEDIYKYYKSVEVLHCSVLLKFITLVHLQ